MSPQAVVSLIDDDLSVLSSLRMLLAASGFAVNTFTTPHEFLKQHQEDVPGCLIVDLKMPEMDGLQLSEHLQERGCRHPMIILSGHGSISDAVRAMRLGAVDFIEKPVSQEVLLDTVSRAVARDSVHRKADSLNECVARSLEKLSQREREVLDQVIAGQLSKQIATNLDISIKTVEVYRSQIMKKLGCSSIAQLVRTLTEFQASQNAKSSSAWKVPEGQQ